MTSYQPETTYYVDGLYAKQLVLRTKDVEGPPTLIERFDGDPNGEVDGNPGNLIINAASGELWIRTTTGWERIATTGIVDADDFAINALAWGVPNDGSDAADAINELLAFASAATAENRRNQRVRFPTGDYIFGSDIIIPNNVEVWGDGTRTRFRQRNGASMVIAPIAPGGGLSNSTLQNFEIRGEGPWPEVSGVGIDMRRALRTSVFNVKVWDFQTGIVMSEGGEGIFSAYNVVGFGVECNRCPTGIRCGPRGNGNRIDQVRIFFSYNEAGTGVAVDCDSAVAQSMDAVTVDGADTCVQLRSTDFYPLIIEGGGNFLEPGLNPFDAEAGYAYDVDILDVEGASINLRAVYPSASRAIARLDPEGQHIFDAPSQLFFGGRYDGAAGPKRNWIFNGMWSYYNDDIVPGLVGGSLPLPSYEQVQTVGDFVTGVRSLRLTANGTGGTLSMGFQVADNGVRWMTVGVRYRVEGDNTGFVFSAQAQGGDGRQHADSEPTPPGTWRVGTVTFPIDPSDPDRSASISFAPDIVDGTGSVLIDEVWAVPGKYATPSTQYGNRYEFLPSPITIYSETLSALTFRDDIDILTLYETLADPELADFATPPYGTIGAKLRLRVTTDTGGALGAALGTFHGCLVGIPGTAGVVADDFERVYSQFNQVPSDKQVDVRTTTITGLYYPGDGFPSVVEIALVAWITS